jgi:hypothetical protein
MLSIVNFYLDIIMELIFVGYKMVVMEKYE